MKKNIIFCLSLILICWACKKDQMIEPDAKKSVESDAVESKTDVSITDESITDEFIDTTNYDYMFHPMFNADLNYDSITDIDGNVYKTIQIGNQVWMAENLKTTRYNDGSPIYLGIGDIAGETDWFDLRKGAFCWYDNNAENKWMGAIYNWFAIESGNLAPEGWQVPTNSDWEILIDYLGGEKSAHDKLLSSGTNESGFSAVPSPILCGWGFGPEISFWSANSHENPHAFVPYADYFSIWTENSVPRISLFGEPQSYGFSVRCVKDDNP